MTTTHEYRGYVFTVTYEAKDPDMIYFDGGFSNIALGEQYRWRYVPQIAIESAAMWNREVRVGGAVTGSSV